MIGLLDVEYSLMRDAHNPADGVDESSPEENEVIYDLERRGLIIVSDLSDDVLQMTPTKLGRVVYQVERAIRSGIIAV